MKLLAQILSKAASNGTLAEIGDISSTLRDEPESDCDVCRGARFVRVSRPADHPRFGKAEPCQCVLDEREDVRRDRLERASNIGALKRFTFDSLAPESVEGHSEAAREGATRARRHPFSHAAPKPSPEAGSCR